MHNRLWDAAGRGNRASVVWCVGCVGCSDGAKLQREAHRRHLAQDRRVQRLGERRGHGVLHELRRVQHVERRLRRQQAKDLNSSRP